MTTEKDIELAYTRALEATGSEKIAKRLAPHYANTFQFVDKDTPESNMLLGINRCVYWEGDLDGMSKVIDTL